MAHHAVLALAAAALLLLSGCATQNNETSTRVGAAGATSQSQQVIVPGNGGAPLAPATVLDPFPDTQTVCTQDKPRITVAEPSAAACR